MSIDTKAEQQALIELRALVSCRCHPAYRDRGMHDPDCHCDDAASVDLIAAALDQRDESLRRLRELVFRASQIVPLTGR